MKQTTVAEMDVVTEPFELLCTEEPRNKDRGSHAAAKGEGYEDKCHLIAVAYCSKSIFSYESSCHKAICNIVDLLEYHRKK